MFNLVEDVAIRLPLRWYTVFDFMGIAIGSKSKSIAPGFQKSDTKDLDTLVNPKSHSRSGCDPDPILTSILYSIEDL